MEFKYTTLENCAGATGMVIVIDVLRAFSTATYYSLQVDRFNSALVVERNNGQLIMRANG